MTVTSKLVRSILDQYVLPIDGIHGIGHWARVLENGIRLAASTGADTDVVALFAVFHDAKRRNENKDSGHGKRGADMAHQMRGKSYELSSEKFELLYTACEKHACGLTEEDITVQTCWDADRLDLGRVGITPMPRLLCTDAAAHPNLFSWAHPRARNRSVPALVVEDWAISDSADNS